MRSLARITTGVMLAAGLVTISSVPSHAQVRVNQTCTIAINFTLSNPLTLVASGTYTRGYFANCTNVNVSSTPVVGLSAEAHSGSITGSVNGTCAVALLGGNPLLGGNGDWRNGAGLLIGGSVIVAGSATPLTTDVLYTEVDVMLPDAGLPCLGETHATGVQGVNDTVL